jgi:cytochrome c oxidase assembly protein subunit 15
VALIQGIVGYAQWFTDLPWALVGVHVTLAVLLWVSLVMAWVRVQPRLLLAATASK